MLYHVDQKHTYALALSKSDPNTVRFKGSYNVGKVKPDTVAGKLRACNGRGKGRTARAPASRQQVAPRNKSVPAPIACTETSQQKGGSGDSDESHGSEEGSSGEEEDSDKEDSDDEGDSEDEDVDEGEEGEEEEEEAGGGARRRRRRKKRKRRKSKRRRRTSARESVFGRGRGSLILLMAKQRRRVSVLTRIFGIARGEVDATAVGSWRARPSGISLSPDVSGKFGLMI